MWDCSWQKDKVGRTYSDSNLSRICLHLICDRNLKHKRKPLLNFKNNLLLDLEEAFAIMPVFHPII
jgi:hypothetical protein